MLKKTLLTLAICLLSLAIWAQFPSRYQDISYAGSGDDKPLKSLSDKDNQFQDDAAKQLSKLAQGVNDSMNENKDWFTQFIEKLKNQDFFKNIGNFFRDILQWFAKISGDIVGALQPSSWKKYIQEIQDNFSK